MGALRIPSSTKQAPMFAGVWNLSTVLNKNDDGSWYQVGNKAKTGVTFQGFVNKEQLEAAMEARKLLISGDFEVDYDSTVDKKSDSAASGAGSDGPMGDYVPPTSTDDEIPF